MIRLFLNKHRELKAGDILRLRVVSYEEADGKPMIQDGHCPCLSGDWTLRTDDVTPLPGAEPPGYACWSCGIVVPVKEDGGLPDGWMMKEYGDGVNYPKGYHFFCDAEFCQKSKMCRLCGCNDEHACDPPCHWVDVDRCSGCEA